MARFLLPRLSTILLLSGPSCGCDYVFAERSPDIILQAFSRPTLLFEKYEDVKPWNSKYENFVKLYLEEKEKLHEGEEIFTEEELKKFKKLEDDYYLTDYYSAGDTLRMVYICFMIVGGIVWVLSMVVLYFNERKYKSLHRVRSKIADYLVETEEGKTDEKNDNRLIFAKSKLEFEEPARDDLLGFESTDGILLRRNVEILQWQCKYDSANDKQFFVKIWSQKPIDSRRYPLKYRNEEIKMPFTSESFYGRIKLGDFTLRKQQMDDLLETQVT